jgi:predicted acetyltransferase
MNPVSMRPLQVDDMEMAMSLIAYSFNDARRRSNLNDSIKDFLSYQRLEWTLGAFEGEELLGLLAWTPSSMRLVGQDIGFGIAGPGVVRPDFRRRGIARGLLKECIKDLQNAGAVWAGLETSIGRWHRGNEWDIATEARCYKFRLTDLEFEVSHSSPHVRTLFTDALDQLSRAYEANAQWRNGSIVRGPLEWRRLHTHCLMQGFLDVAVILDKMGEIRSYMLFIQGDGSRKPTEIVELVAQNPDDYRALLLYLKSHNVLDTVEWSAPPDDQLRAYFVEPSLLQVEQRPDKYIRVIDSHGFLTALLPHASHQVGGSFVIEIIDSLLATNSGRWEVAFGNGSGTVSPTEKLPDIVVPIRYFGTLALGSLGIGSARRSGLVNAVDGRGLDAAGRYFQVDHAPFCADFL